MAFLRAIEDREEEDDSTDFLGFEEEAQLESPDSQSQEQDPARITESVEPQAALPQSNDLKRKFTDESDNTENIPPANKHPRRTTALDTAPKKARTLEEIRESVSFLIDEPSVIPDSQYSDAESDNEQPLPPTRQNIAIVDRLSAKRSAAASTATDANGNLAFVASEKSFAPGFRVPSLIRRSTSSSIVSNSSTSSGSTTMSTTNSKSVAHKKSSIHAQAREAERRVVIEAAEKRKRDEVRKTAIGVGRRSVLGVLKARNNGGFE